MFQFDKAYRVMIQDPDGEHLLGIAMGIRPFSDDYPEPYEDKGRGHGFEWIPNSPMWPVRRHFLDVVHDSRDRVEAKSMFAKFNGYDVTYVFEPLTMDNFTAVKDEIQGFDSILASNDEELQEFYLDAWMREDWKQHPGHQEEIDALIARARTLLQAAQLAADEATQVREGVAAEVGDKHKWKVGWVEKQRDGSWKGIIGPSEAPVGTVIKRGDIFLQKTADDWEEVPVRGRDLPGKWKDTAEGLPEDTEEEHTTEVEGGGLIYSDARKKVHRKIKDAILAGLRPAPADERPVVVLTMGLPAAGKSTAIRETMRTDNFAHIDTDAIREQLPEFKAAVAQRAKNAGSIVDTEAATIADDVLAEAIKNRNNLIFEGVGANEEWMKYLISQFRGGVGPNVRDYKIVILMLHEEDVEAAISRADSRGRKTGRFVPARHIRSAQPKIPGTFTAISDSVDEFTVFSAGDPPVKKWKKREDHPEQVLDAEFVDRFLAHSKLEWWTYLIGVSLTEEPKKPATTDLDKILDMFERAWGADRSEIEKMPEQYDDGVMVSAEDPKPR